MADSNLNEHEILISSYLLKRNKSKNWQKKWWVLRRNQLSYYKDSKEYKASKVIPIGNILSFSKIPDNHSNHFIIVTNERIYHLRSLTLEEFNSWFNILTMILNLNDDEEFNNGSKNFFKPRKISENLVIKDANQDINQGNNPEIDQEDHGNDEEIEEIGQELHRLNFSGTDDNFTSGLSDGGLSHSSFHHNNVSSHANNSNFSINHSLPPPIPENSIFNKINNDEIPNVNEDPETTYNSLSFDSPEHLIAKGYLLRLKKRYNQWKKYYIILTNRSMIFYKNLKDYESNKSYKKINLNELIDVVELDPLSKNKLYCMLIITPMKRIRFCAENEDELIKWLVLLKAIIKTRKNATTTS
ncbi:FYVE, RhoGEF and PH domain-containing protein 6 [Wickerhamomyces ciferrii]|uniref:FYVE, RhoGEF and PH domain-containing protein 6 n=1 Tax=Wickerhamomyces ciferrii (strain ATCC 14091 / BCRC 22168 / CBS 111 / JCM 3599 / NBRC 0793 / NRRL Y-1031 F-60-10) TaxID=1206466 RepID=K0KFT7_WICCF|nr:FYVE, RhoGEF and PH domain-containing protein 6 [Wickerhamomyces ciferrii]CCH44025.1 FYVE, RhoGEF and PH domain-containing protein 6 [Wickerhamomyces ciferrii]